MSTAELTARQFYDSYHIGALPSDVKRHLMILMLSAANEDTYADAFQDEESSILSEPALPPYTMEELRARLEASEADIAAGRTYPMEEMLSRMEEKYPWLCE